MLAALALAATSVWPMYQRRPDHNAVVSGPSRPARWVHRFHAKINGGLAYANGALFVESFDRRVTALDARTGAVLWSTRVPNVVMTTPIVADGLVIAGTGDERRSRSRRSRVRLGKSRGRLDCCA